MLWPACRLGVLLAFVSFALFGQSTENLRTCLDGRYPVLCDHSALTQAQAALVTEAEKRANLRSCLDGRYPALCNHSLLAQHEATLVAKAERAANLRACLDGRYTALCNHGLLTDVESEQVRTAERLANLSVCLEGRYSALCDHALLNSSEAKAVLGAERRENLRICLDVRYSALCDHALLEVTQERISAPRVRRAETTREHSYRPVEPLVSEQPSAPTAPSSTTTNSVRNDLLNLLRGHASSAASLALVSQPTPKAQTTSLPTPTVSRFPPLIYPACAENGSCYGDISIATGRPKTVRVGGYYRRDGTYVRGHYRSARRR